MGRGRNPWQRIIEDAAARIGAEAERYVIDLLFPRPAAPTRGTDPPRASRQPAAEAAGPWKLLGLDPSASREACEAVWRAMAKANHPDRGGDPARFKDYAAAWEAIRQARGWK